MVSRLLFPICEAECCLPLIFACIPFPRESLGEINESLQLHIGIFFF